MFMLICTWTLYENSHVPFCPKTADWACESMWAGKHVSRHSVLILASLASRVLFCCYWAIATLSYVSLLQHNECVSAWITVLFFFLLLSFHNVFSVALRCNEYMYVRLFCSVRMHIETEHITLTDTSFYVGWQLNGIIFCVCMHARARFSSEGLIFSWMTVVFFCSILTGKTRIHSTQTYKNASHGSNEKWQYDLLDIEFLLPGRFMESHLFKV